MKPLRRISWAIVCSIALIGAGSIGAAPPDGKGKPKKKEVNSVQLAQTGQTTSYRPGDDGDLRAGVASPDPRFTDNGNGTVTDNLTSLTWPIQFGFYSRPNGWYTAIDYCNADELGGFDDWRLPNFKELISVLDFEQSDPMLPVGHPFLNVPPLYDPDISASSFYWTSTAGSHYQGRYLFNIASGDLRIWGVGAGGYTICVRGGI